MRTSARTRYSGYRFPAEIIGHTVWPYFRFPLGLLMVEELLAARGIIVSHETVRQWVRKFGQQFANDRSEGPSPPRKSSEFSRVGPAVRIPFAPAESHTNQIVVLHVPTRDLARWRGSLE